MLQFMAKDVNISKITKILAKYNIEASINHSQITIFGDVPEEVIEEVVKNQKIEVLQNFESDAVEEKVPESNDFENDDFQSYKNVSIDSFNEVGEQQGKISKYDADIKYPVVKYGEVYWCELPDQGDTVIYGRRPVIVVSNNWVGCNANKVLVVPCTTHIKRLLTTKVFKFSTANITNYAKELLDGRESTALVEETRAVDKRRLKKYGGTMTEEFMNELQEIIEYTFDLSDKKIKTEVINQNAISIETIRMLSFVNICELLEIVNNFSYNTEIQVEKCIQLFGFNLENIGVQYLKKAILVSIMLNNKYFNLEILSKKVEQMENGVKYDEIKRLMIARVKETFGFKKAPTIEFIRLIKNLIENVK